MAKYLMLGKYSLEAVKGISAERTGKAKAIVEKAGGKFSAMLALLGGYDLAFIADFPGTKEVMQASLGLTKLTGIAFTTFPAVTIEEFDKLAG
jgi:uncharacterized protein with GYD domain